MVSKLRRKIKKTFESLKPKRNQKNKRIETDEKY